MIEGIDHIGVIVDDLGQAQEFLESIGFRMIRTFAAGARLKGAFYGCGDGQIEVIEIIEPSERATRLGSDAARVEHIGLRVGNLTESMEALKGLGVAFKDHRILRVGSTLNIWTEPSTCDGVMYQLTQYMSEHSENDLHQS